MPDLCADLRVVELPGSTAASFCGALLAGVGAHVLKVEPPGGDPQRCDPALFAAVSGGKSSRVVDPSDIAALDAALDGADVVLVGASSDDPFGADATVSRRMAADPGLVVTWLSPFGRSGPLCCWASSDLVQLAMSLWLQATGRPERSPLAVGGRLAELVPGLAAASATMMALRARRLTGAGQLVDVSHQEALLLCQPYFELAHAYTGVERVRNGMPFPMTIVPAADGYLGVNVLTQSHWELLCAFSERGDLLDDSRFGSPAERAPHARELTETFAEWAADKPKAATFVEGQGWRIPFGYVPHLDEVTAVDQHVARRFFSTVAGPDGAAIELPASPFLVDGTRRRAAGAPSLGAELPAPDRAGHAALAEGGASMDHGPLAGVKVVDLSMFWSGPLTAELFAQYGADVVKVESVQRVDGWRGLSGNPGIEASNLFNGVNLNKAGITLDLTSPQGRELLRPLVEAADVLIENFSPRVMANFGLDDDVLHSWNRRLVILSMPAFGLTGPWGEYVGFAPTIEQLSGLPELTRYPDGPPALSGNSLADPCAGLAGCFALLATLHAGREGAHIDLSQLEALTSLLAPDLVRAQLSSEPRPSDACAGVHPAAGDDRWIVIDAPTDEAWRALASVAGCGWETDTRFATATDRAQHASQLTAAIAAWTAAHDNVALAARLQAAGVPAAPVLRPSQLDDDGHLLARGSRQELAREHVPVSRYTVLPFKFGATPGRVHRPAPTLGEHNATVLNLTDAELADLRAARIIGETID